MQDGRENDRVSPWRVLHSELVLDNQWAKVRLDACQLPTGTIIPDYYYWEGGDYAQVFAMTPDNNVVLTRQYKHGVKEIVTELPAGLVDPSDGTTLDAARRELKEETGYEGDDWVRLGQLNVSSAKSTARAHIFLSRSVTRTSEPSPDANEIIEVLLLSVEGVLRLITQGVIRDSSSVATTLLALQILGRQM